MLSVSSFEGPGLRHLSIPAQEKVLVWGFLVLRSFALTF